MALISMKELSELADVSKSAVSQAVKAGRLFREADGKFNTDSELTIRYLDEVKINKKNFNLDRGIPEKSLPGNPDGSTLDVFCEINGREHHVIQHFYDSHDKEGDPVIFPLPIAVRIEYLNDVSCYTLEGLKLPTRAEVHGIALEKIRMVHV